MRQGGTLYYLFADHLGSTSVVATSAGSKSAEVRYRAWGEDRYTSGTAPTSFRYTGQRVETSLGLYFYGARWFDSSLGRFLSPDSVVPDPYNPFDLDRYACVRNNPLRYNDPTGHMCSDPEDPTPTCEAGGGSNKLERVNYGKDKDNLTEGGRKAYQYYQRARNNTGLLNNNKTGPITDLILQLPGSAENWSNLATGIDIMAWLTDIYATSVVTYAGIAGAALPAPLIAAGLPEVPMATGLAGMALAELYIQPVLFTGNALATISMGATIVADTKGGNTRIEEAKFSSNTANSMALTDVGWLSNEAYLSLTLQSIAVANDLQWSSLPFPVFP